MTRALNELSAERLQKELQAKEQERSQFAKENPVQFLAGLGLHGSGVAEARQLCLKVQGHEEEHGCTYYQIVCTLRGQGHSEDRLWTCKRRLCQLREDLLDVIMESMGDDYDTHFSATPFALRGGLPGTTARLTRWFETLATCINQNILQQHACALVLNFLQAPILGSDTPAFSPPSRLPQQSRLDLTVRA